MLKCYEEVIMPLIRSLGQKLYHSYAGTGRTVSHESKRAGFPSLDQRQFDSFQTPLQFISPEHPDRIAAFQLPVAQLRAFLACNRAQAGRTMERLNPGVAGIHVLSARPA